MEAGTNADNKNICLFPSKHIDNVSKYQGLIVETPQLNIQFEKQQISLFFEELSSAHALPVLETKETVILYSIS